MVGVSEVLAGVFGAAFSLVATFLYDKQKDKEKKKALIRLILTDLESQQLAIEAYNIEMEFLKKHIESGSGEIGYNIGNVINTDIYNSNSKIDYHRAFGVNRFKDLVNIYALVERLMTDNAYNLFSNFNIEVKKIEKGSQNYRKDVGELKNYYLYKIETFVAISNHLVTSLGKFRSKFKR